jgi:hypothetical protein
MGGGEGKHESRGNGFSGDDSRILRSPVNVGFLPLRELLSPESSIRSSKIVVVSCQKTGFNKGTTCSGSSMEIDGSSDSIHSTTSSSLDKSTLS